jgi:hypothetical protein
MIAYPWGALFTGLMLILAGCLTMARHTLLEPASTHYPKAPMFVRNFMFLFAAVLLFLGLRYVWVFYSGQPNTTPPQPDPSMQLLAIALVVYKTAMLCNIIRQRYPEQIWNRLNRINESLRCKDKDVINWFR